MRGCLPLDRGVGCQNNLAHAIGFATRLQAGKVQLLRPIPSSADSAAQH